MLSPSVAFADKTAMQHRLFAELSAMFGREVPLYDKALLVNRACNQAVAGLLAAKHGGFALPDGALDKASGERHGAIRIGTAEEYRLVAGFFAAFGMEPHGFYDMTSLGAKSQPIIATAFRATRDPEHRVFCSLLMTEGFVPETRAAVENLLAGRRVFSDRARELVARNEAEGGLDETDAADLIREGVETIFKWTGRARDRRLYDELSAAGLKIAADIACFESHHLNHLTPNTFWLDLYTAAMKYLLGELDRAAFTARATSALTRLCDVADRHYMKLHFRHLTAEDIAAFDPREVSDADVAAAAAALAETLSGSEFDLSALKHAGFKDFTEGPPVQVPVLLRQDSYKALTEPVSFREADGTVVESSHTARFGEIEQRFYATTPVGRATYDRCLAAAEAARAADPTLAARDHEAYVAAYGSGFAAFPTTLPALVEAGLVHARYSPTPAGLSAAAHSAATLAEITVEPAALVAAGYARYEGLRYEDFLPFSAAGIFASNLGQYGTETAGAKPEYTKATLEAIMGRAIVEPAAVSAGQEAESLLETYDRLGLTARVAPADMAALHAAVEAYRALAGA